MKRILVIVILFAAGAFTLNGCGMFGSYEEPSFSLDKDALDKGEGWEIQHRNYEAKIIAEVETTGDKSEAANQGFRMLADYIFGNNISMTTPVLQEKSESIDMTTPVLQEKFGAGYKVAFVMPKEYTLETLPKPKSDKVKIYKAPAYRAIAIKFSGSSGQGNMDEHDKILQDYILKNNIKVKPTPAYAYYDPPWTPWFMKRNEIIYTIR